MRILSHRPRTNKPSYRHIVSPAIKREMYRLYLNTSNAVHPFEASNLVIQIDLHC